MDPRSRSDSDGGGRPPAGPRRDPGGLTDPGWSSVLSLDRIRITGSRNEYTPGPQQKDRSVPSPVASRSGGTRHGFPGEGMGSVGSTCPDRQVIWTEPKHSELKPLSRRSAAQRSHPNKCEGCGRCRCAECRCPRALPSRWLCGRRCMCSAQSVAEYGTCVCCLKGLFYHCSSDDEETCADKPFSRTQSHCCARWTAVSLLAPLFPCLLCYLPAKGCVAAAQSCYDRATRPGCRCEDPPPPGPSPP